AYLSERQWGTVREDYSADGNAWDYLPHDHARSRAYRWGEDGIGGLWNQASAAGALAASSRLINSSLNLPSSSAFSAGQPTAGARTSGWRLRSVQARSRGEKPPSFAGASASARSRDAPPSSKTLTSSRSRSSDRPRRAHNLFTRISCGESTEIVTPPTCTR